MFYIYSPGGVFHTIEILDTAGLHQFPAMRRLSIMSGDAFIVVFSVDNRESFEEALQLIQLIFETKGELQLHSDSWFPLATFCIFSYLLENHFLQISYFWGKYYKKKIIHCEAI